LIFSKGSPVSFHSSVVGAARFSLRHPIDDDPSNGCETPCIPFGAEVCNLRDDDCDCDTDEDFILDTDPLNCGSCGNNCTNNYPHAEGGCSTGVCFMLQCDAGWDNCDNWDDNGCEISTDTDIANCGSCANRCSYANAAASCLGGVCVMGACDLGWADCNFTDTDGCEVDLTSDEDNCGNCGNRCLYPFGNGECLGGFCSLESCDAGYDDCDNNEANGCEANLNEDENNCGWCGNICPTGGDTYECENGLCVITQCNPGWEDCDGLPGNGCETNVANGDTSNCGDCGVVCNLPNATPDCVNSTCVVDSCNLNWENCDLGHANGCEINTSNDENHCGGCGLACSSTACNCPIPNPPDPSCCHAASWDCTSSTCDILTCQADYFNLDGSIGCECQSLDSVSSICNNDPSSNLGWLGAVDTRHVEGNLVPAGDEDWYTFVAPDNTAADIGAGSDSYNLHIALSGGGPTTGIYYDLYRSTNASANCSGKGSPICVEDAQSSDWRIDCAQSGSLCGDGSTTNCTCTDDTARFWIRVYRRAGSAVTCDQYEIDISFTQ
jgi:hypothetical protein